LCKLFFPEGSKKIPSHRGERGKEKNGKSVIPLSLFYLWAIQKNALAQWRKRKRKKR